MGQVIDLEAEKAHRATLAKAKELVANPPKEEWEQLIPFQSDALPPFPTDALPAWLGDYVRSLAESTQTPEDLAGTLSLAAVALMAAKRVEVSIWGGWKEPLNLYTVVTMESGSGKSPVFEKVFTPIGAWEAHVREQRRGGIEQARQARQVLEARRERFRKEAANAKVKQDRELAEREVRALTAELAENEPPTEMELFANDVTPEALASLMKDNGERMALLDSEGGVFETFAGRYSDGVANLDLFLKGHEGGAVKIRRKGSGSLVLKKPALTVGITVQPSVLQDLQKKDGFRGRGLLARFLYALPVSLVGRRRLDVEREIPLELEACYRKTMTALLALTCQDNEEQEPVLWHFDKEAVARFRAFWKESEGRLAEGGDLSGLKDWGGKYPGTVARLAGLLHLGDTLAIDARSLIPLATLERAIRLGDYFQRHSSAAFGEMALEGVGDPCRRILEWIEKRGAESFSQRELHKALDHVFPRVKLLEEPLKTLEERGYIREQEKLFVSTGRPSKIYDVNPAFLESIGTMGTKGTKPQNSPLPISKQRETGLDIVLSARGQNPVKEGQNPLLPPNTVFEEGEIR